MPELRKDPIVGRWVIIATERTKRPHDFGARTEPRRGLCPFCPGQESMTPSELYALRPSDGPGARANAPGWRLRAFPNKFPALRVEGELDRHGDGIYDRMNGIGAHEVIVETPEHTKRFSDLSEADIAGVLHAYRHRMHDLSRDQRLKYVMIFKNHGTAAGASLDHPHSQLIALPVVPRVVSEEMKGAKKHWRLKERCVFCDIVRQELKERTRLVYENPGYLVCEPYAPKFPFETWILPRSHRARFEGSSNEDFALLANALKIASQKLNVALDDPPYNFILHTTPFGEGDPEYYHWHIEIMPSLMQVAGFEWGSGFYINPTPPEEAAKFLREIEPGMKILHVASEVAPYSKTGGLADVLGALPRALAALGHEVTVVTPRYRLIDPERFGLARRLRGLATPLGADTVAVGVFEGQAASTPHVRVYLVDHKPSFDRDGIYGDAKGDYADNARRFALLGSAALALAAEFGAWPDVVHGHDWQAGPAILFAKRPWSDLKPPKTVFTLHNLAFQGLFPEKVIDELGLPREYYTPEGFEYYGQASFLKAGLALADHLSTVSPRYAREIQTPEQGLGFDGLLRARNKVLHGILNGVDYDIWNPDRDIHLPETYSAGALAGKRACKAALQRELGLPVRADVPLSGSISRLTDQKGFDLILAALPKILEGDAQYVVLGSGDPALESAFRQLTTRFSKKLAVRIGYDEALSHRIEAGCDVYVMPSKFEPCGLNQMYSLRYGTPPIVRATGGLDDTIVDFEARSRSGTGFKFEPYEAGALASAWQRALAAYRNPADFTALIKRCMAQDFSWHRAAEAYAHLYRSIA